jgi:hypothetical protein
MSRSRVADDIGAPDAFETVGQETAQKSQDDTSHDCEDEQEMDPSQMVDDDYPESTR